MATPFKKVQSKAVTLYANIAGSDISMRVTPFPVDLDGNKLTMAALGTTPQVTVDPKILGVEEIIGFTNLVDNGDNTGTFTGLLRDLASSSLATPGTGKAHGAGAKVVISWNPQDVARMAALENDQTFQGTNSFLLVPNSSQDPVGPNDLTRLSYVQALVLGTLTTINVIVPGTAGATIAAGQLVYFDDPTNVWLLCDADFPATVNNVLLGIAQGAGTIGNAIANGILLQGVDTHQSGLTIGQTYYASNTPGSISSTPGTTSVTVGIGKTATTLYFAPRFNQQLTQDQFNALVGDLGTPSATNLFMTQLGFQNRTEVSGTSSGGATTVIGAVTITLASPGVLTTATPHGLIVGDTITLATSGALPTGLTAGTTYYVISAGLTATSFELSATAGGSAINTSVSQSGTHTLTLTTNNYILTVVPQPSAYAAGQKFTIKASFTSTGQATAQIGTLARVFIKRLSGTTAIIAGDIVSGQEFDITNDGTLFQMGTPSAISPTSPVFAMTSGTTSTTVTFAHGFGRAPKLLKLFANANPSSGSIAVYSSGSYDGTTNRCVYYANTTLSALDATACGYIKQNTAAGNDAKIVASWDATNVTLTISNPGGGGASGFNYVMEVFG